MAEHYAARGRLLSGSRAATSAPTAAAGGDEEKAVRLKTEERGFNQINSQLVLQVKKCVTDDSAPWRPGHLIMAPSAGGGPDALR